MTQRRYRDDEVHEIFALAAAADGSTARPLTAESDGLTIRELQEIGVQAGIEPSRITAAANALDARGKPAPLKRSLGLPVGVSRVVDLPRAPNDSEWDQMISEFRSTFGVPGQITTTGGLRDWSHGNLHISVEPTPHGHQLRLSTVKGDATSLNALGVVMATMSVLLGAVILSAGKPGKAFVIVGMFAGLALAAFGANIVRLPRWAREREHQMESLAEYSVTLLSKVPERP